MKKQMDFNGFYNKYSKLVYKIAYGILKNHDDSQDVMQNVFSKIYELDKNKMPNKNELSWIYKVTKNETISYLRKKKNDVDLDSIYEIKEEDKNIENIFDTDGFNRLIANLKEDEKEIISLKILSDLSFSQISKLLKKPIGTVKWKYYKAITNIKLVISNFALFIVTFVIGLKATKIEKKQNREDTKVDLEDEENRTEPSIEDKLKNSTKSGNESKEYNDYANIVKETNEVIEENIKENNNNNIGNIMIGVSGVFLVLTIIFTIFFKKYQPKQKKKSSK